MLAVHMSPPKFRSPERRPISESKWIYNRQVDTEVAVKLAKWGNSLAVRIPAEVVAKLGFSPDQEVEIKVTGEHSFEVMRDRRREEAIEKMRKLRFVVPEDYVFNRDEIYDR